MRLRVGLISCVGVGCIAITGCVDLNLGSGPVHRTTLDLSGTVYSATDHTPIPGATVELRSGGSACLPVLDNLVSSVGRQVERSPVPALASVLPRLARRATSVRWGPACVSLAVTEAGAGGEYQMTYVHEYEGSDGCSGLVMSASAPGYIGGLSTTGRIRCVRTPQTVDVEMDEITDVEVTPPQVRLTVGVPFSFSSRAISSRGDTVSVPGGQGTWTSDPESVATVDPRGLVMPISEGSATITSDVGGYTDSAHAVVESYLPMPTGPVAYVMGSFGVSAIDVTTGRRVPSGIPIGGGDLAIAPDGLHAYMTRWNRNDVRVIDTSTNVVLPDSIPVGMNPRGIAIAPDGAHAYVVNEGSNDVSVIELATHSVLASIPVVAGPNGIVITPDGSRAYVSSPGGVVVAIDLAIRAVIGDPIAVGAGPVDLVVTPDGTRVYVATQFPRGVSTIDIATHRVVDSPIPVVGVPRSIAITPDGGRAYVAMERHGVAVLDLAANVPVTVVQTGDITTDVGITPEGALAFVTNENGTVSVIDLPASSLVGIPIGLQGRPEVVRIKP